MSKRKARIGSSFDDFLKDEGIYEATEAVAIKRVLAWQVVEKTMKDQRLTKAEKARRVSSRSSSFRTRAKRPRVVK